MDVYISYICKLFISNNTGLDGIAVMFRKPILHIGSLPFGAISTFSSRYYNTMSNYYSYEKKRFLRQTEIFNLNLQSNAPVRARQSYGNKRGHGT